MNLQSGRRAFSAGVLAAISGLFLALRRGTAGDGAALLQAAPDHLARLASAWDIRVVNAGLSSEVRACLPVVDGRPLQLGRAPCVADAREAWRVERSSIRTTAGEAIEAVPGVVRGLWHRGSQTLACVEAVLGAASQRQERWDLGVVYTLVLEVACSDGSTQLIEVLPTTNARLCPISERIREVRLLTPDQSSVILRVILD